MITARSLLRPRRILPAFGFAAVWLLLCLNGWAADLSALCADRAAIERVYYLHRLGEKPPFEQVSPPVLIERLVKQDRHKEAVLKRVYSVEITPKQIESELGRINATTRAPDVLAELKAALGNDPARFARSIAKPILVERALRERFDNDDQLHAQQRQEAEVMRGRLLAAREGAEDPAALLKQTKVGRVENVTWQLGARPSTAEGSEELAAKAGFGPQAQVMSSTGDGGQKLYFADLPLELQRVLRAQLNHTGDISAVIETPGGFLLYVATETTSQVLSVIGLSIPKRNYEQWLQAQAD